MKCRQVVHLRGRAEVWQSKWTDAIPTEAAQAAAATAHQLVKSDVIQIETVNGWVAILVVDISAVHTETAAGPA